MRTAPDSEIHKLIFRPLNTRRFGCYNILEAKGRGKERELRRLQAPKDRSGLLSCWRQMSGQAREVGRLQALE